MLNLGVWWRRHSILMYRLSGDEEGQDRYEALGPCVSRLTWEPQCRNQTTARGCKPCSGAHRIHGVVVPSPIWTLHREVTSPGASSRQLDFQLHGSYSNSGPSLPPGLLLSRAISSCGFTQ